jgi:predicted lipase
MKTIQNRGRTNDGVLNPKNYAPFEKVPDKAAFEAAWEKNQAWVFANMAHAAYCDKEYLEELLGNFGASIKFYQSNTDRHGVTRGREAFLAIWPDKAILSFRGTEAADKLKINLRENKLLSSLPKNMLPSEFELSLVSTDLVDDLDFSPVTHKNEHGQSQVHRGFFNATNELWPEISKDLENLERSQANQLFVTGHSLGAAMAVIAGIKYSFDEIVTFGEPAVGNDLDNTISPACSHIRYVNGIDPVTKIVPKALYRHHGQIKKIEDIDGPDLRFDHSIINYAIVLESNI